MELFPKPVLCLISLFTLVQTDVTFAETVNINSKVELEYHSKIQLGHFLAKDCSRISCDALKDGWRVAEIDGRLKRYLTDGRSLVFAELGVDVGDESTAMASVFQPNFDNTSGLAVEDDDIEQAVLGYSYRQSEFSIGKHELKTNLFGPSVNNYLQFSLSGFNDDRIDWFSYEVEESLYASSSTSINSIGSQVYADSLDINGVLGTGVGKFDDSRLSLNYDFLFETTVPGIDNVILSLATRSVTDPNSNKKLDSYGVKVNVFNSNGSEITVGLTENDFGRYAEFAFSYIWMYRNKFTFGGTDFNTDSDKTGITKGIPISDATFFFASYTYAISELFQVFVEYSEIDSTDSEIENVLIGLYMSF